MSKLEVKTQPRKPKVTHPAWFRSLSSGHLYRSGDKGMCITAGGAISAGLPYGSATILKGFENTERYERLEEGDQIIITL